MCGVGFLAFFTPHAVSDTTEKLNNGNTAESAANQHAGGADDTEQFEPETLSEIGHWKHNDGVRVFPHQFLDLPTVEAAQSSSKNGVPKISQGN